MSKPMRRTGPRFTVWIDLNLQWLSPKFSWKGSTSMGYIHLGWFSAGFGFGIVRDAMWDAFDKGIGYKEE